MRLRLNAAMKCVALTLVVLSLVLPPVVLADPGKPRPNRPELGRPGQGPGKHEPTEILVKFKTNTDEPEKRSTHAKHGGRVKDTLPELDVHVIEVPAGQEKDRAADYRKEKAVEFAEVNGFYYAQATPNDPMFGNQWGLNNTGQNGGKADADIDASESWDARVLNGTVPIAIVDSGILATHEDLAGRVSKAKDFTRSGTTDRYGHGTHVAGIAGAAMGNARGVAGTCPNCTLFNVKVLRDSDGSGAWSDIANGIVWAANNGAKVINMSFGAYSPSNTVESAVNLAWSKGVVLVAAAGNDGQNWGFYPGVYDNVIAVAATDRNDQRWSLSNWGGNWVDVAAPGVQVLSTVRSGGYEYWDGTSMAAPHVSGSAGLVWSRGDCSNATCVRDRIKSRADSVGQVGTDWEDNWAHGRVNACRAVRNAPTCEPNG